ncbi:MFS transporter [Streptomonospora alba]|uniref:MFS transporter n=1 Tax=Streptomonospora alba TaxID=183763 RepID=UPI0019310CDD|nr:MFS transporter [Streptomonospora alba]
MLAVPGFGRLWLCSTADAWGAFLLPVAVTLALLESGHGASALGLVLAAKTLGHLLATVPGGIAADHWSRPQMISIACLARVLSTSLLLFCITSGPTWIVAACVFVVGAGEGILRPSHLALVGDIVPEPQQQSAIALTTIAFRIALVLSPGVATALTLWSGPATVLIVSIVLWLCAAFAVRKLPRHATPEGDEHVPRHTESVRDKLFGGFRAARAQPWFVAGLLVLTIVLGTTDATQLVLLPVISTEQFGTESVYAVALSMFALGALLGGLVMLRWHPSKPGRLAMIGLAFCAAIPFSLAFSEIAWPIFVAHFVAGVGMEVFNVTWFAAIQREFATDVRARVTSLDFLISYSVSPLSLAVVPLAVAAVGTQPVLVFMGAAVILGGLCALAVPGMSLFRTATAVSAEKESGSRGGDL